MVFFVLVFVLNCHGKKYQGFNILLSVLDVFLKSCKDFSTFSFLFFITLKKKKKKKKKKKISNPHCSLLSYKK